MQDEVEVRREEIKMVIVICLSYVLLAVGVVSAVMALRGGG